MKTLQRNPVVTKRRLPTRTACTSVDNTENVADGGHVTVPRGARPASIW